MTATRAPASRGRPIAIVGLVAAPDEHQQLSPLTDRFGHDGAATSPAMTHASPPGRNQFLRPQDHWIGGVVGRS